MKRLLVLPFLLLALVGADGCEDPRPVEAQTPTNNPEYKVDFLFEKDGCKVYRFGDAGRTHYFTNCEGNLETSWTESCGKNCNRTVYETIQTVVN